ncbi:MAG: response regulator [bacterium]|nr:response regulator [bacterium]
MPWPPNVLIASDKDLTRKLVRDSLRLLGLEIFQPVRSSREALQTLQKEKNRWQLLILDSGAAGALETVKEIREVLGAELKILLLLSAPTREEILAASEAGVNGFVAIPFSPSTLEEKMRAALGITPSSPDEGDPFRIKV